MEACACQGGGWRKRENAARLGLVVFDDVFCLFVRLTAVSFPLATDAEFKHAVAPQHASQRLPVVQAASYELTLRVVTFMEGVTAAVERGVSAWA